MKETNSIKTVTINKNRGWRGLAEARIETEDGKSIERVFSFSPHTWNDLICEGVLVIQDKDNYYIIKLASTLKLPLPTQQRSVLIKNWVGTVDKVTAINKSKWTEDIVTRNYINHFIKNRNNHTTSDWNNIGIRVYPTI